MSTNNSRFRESIRIVLPLAILAIGVAGFAAISGREPPETKPEQAKLPLLVQTVPVSAHDARLDIEADGVVVPYREIALAAEVAGRVTFKSPDCRAGRYVKKGTLLVEIDPRTYDLEAKRLAIEMDQAEATLEELSIERENTESLIAVAEEQLTLQKRNTQRMLNLSERKFATDAELDDARQSELAARNNLLTLKNQLQMINTRRVRLEMARTLAQAKLEQAQLDLERTKITAPIDGVIVADMVEEDGYVPPGTLLATMEDTSAVEVQCNLRMEELLWILQQPRAISSSSPEDPSAEGYRLPETPVTVVYKIGDRQYSWEGTLSRYDGIGLNEKTRTVPVRITISNPRSIRTENGETVQFNGGPRALVRGMYVETIVHVQPPSELLRIPQRAVQPGGVVWRVRDGKLNVLPVKAAQILDDAVLIDAQGSKLSASDRLIVSPVAQAVDGMPVREEERTAAR